MAFSVGLFAFRTWNLLLRLLPFHGVGFVYICFRQHALTHVSMSNNYFPGVIPQLPYGRRDPVPYKPPAGSVALWTLPDYENENQSSCFFGMCTCPVLRRSVAPEILMLLSGGVQQTFPVWPSERLLESVEPPTPTHVLVLVGFTRNSGSSPGTFEGKLSHLRPAGIPLLHGRWTVSDDCLASLHITW